MLTLHVSVSYKKCEQAPEIDFGADQGDMAIFNFSRLILFGLVVLLQSCGGGGGSSSGTNGSSPFLNPIRVLPSSFENKAMEGLPVELTSLPKLSVAIGGIFNTNWESVGESLAVADFKRNGTYSAFVIVSDQLNTAKPYFVGYSVSGGYELQDLFDNPSDDQVACPFPQQSLIADLNGDTKPDIYVACSSSVGAVAQYVYLSQPNGKYQKKTTATIVSTPTLLNASSATLADIDGDGCKDVVTNDGGSLILMLGRTCTGNQYTLSAHDPLSGRLPTTGSGDPPNNVQSVFLIPRGISRYDLIVAGRGNQSTPVKWFYNSDGYFGPSITRSGFDLRGYAIAPQVLTSRYDYLESGSYGYIYITNGNNFVYMVQIVKPDYMSTLDTTPRYYFPSDTINPINNWPSYLRVVNDAYLQPYDAACTSTRCNKQFPLTGYQ